MKAIGGAAPMPFSQMGLDQSLVNDNHFLACQCMIYDDIQVEMPTKENRTRFTAMVRGKVLLANQVVRLRLEPSRDFAYRAGQYTTLTNIEGEFADYAIASVHGLDAMMEVHISTKKSSVIDRYLCDEIEINDGLEIQTAYGEVYYQSEYSDKPMLLIAADSELAGAYGLLRDALHQGHCGKIRLIIIMVEFSMPYLHEELVLLAQNNPKFSYTNLHKDTGNLQARVIEDATSWLADTECQESAQCLLWSGGLNDFLAEECLTGSIIEKDQLSVLGV